jgi:hypothetical protein
MRVSWNGKSYELKVLCKRLGLDHRAVLLRVKDGEEPIRVIRSTLGCGRRSHPYVHCDPRSTHKKQTPRGRRFAR